MKGEKMSSKDIANKNKSKYKKRGNPWQHKEDTLIFDSNGQAVLDKDGNQKVKTTLKDWRFYYFIIDPTTGKKTQKYKFGFKTKKEAELALEAIKDKIKNKVPIWSLEFTLREYTEKWLNDYLPHSGLSPCTVRGYIKNANIHILPVLGNFKISEITCRDLEKYYLDLYNDGDGLGKNSIKYIRATLISIFGEAYKDKIVVRNEAKISSMSHKILPSKFKYVTYSAEQINYLLELVKDTYLEVGIALASVLGLRRGEVLGLKYSDIDFATNRIHVHMQIVYEECELLYRPVKANSERFIYMPDFVRDILVRNKAWQDKNKKLLGDEYLDNDFIVTKYNGENIKPGTISKEFSRLLARNNLTHIRFHDLRHSCNSILRELKFDREVRKAITGHRTDQMDELYTHVKDDELKSVSEILQSTFKK